MGGCVGRWVVQWVNEWPHVKSVKSNKSSPNRYNLVMDILDIFWTFYLNHLSPLQGYFFPTKSLKRLHAARIDELADSNKPAINCDWLLI